MIFQIEPGVYWNLYYQVERGNGVGLQKTT